LQACHDAAAAVVQVLAVQLKEFCAWRFLCTGTNSLMLFDLVGGLFAAILACFHGIFSRHHLR